MVIGAAYLIRENREFFQLFPNKDGEAAWGVAVPAVFIPNVGKNVWDRYYDYFVGEKIDSISDLLDNGYSFGDILRALDFEFAMGPAEILD